MPEKRLQRWKADSEKQKKVTEALKNTKIKAAVDKSLQKYKNINSPPDDNSKPSSPAPNSSNTPESSAQTLTGGVAAFTCVKTACSTMNYSIQGSWILENGSNSHVCNSIMLSRFTETHASDPKDRLIAGTQTLLIECYGTIQVTVQTPTGPQQLPLANVAYVSNFMTNLVSQDIFYTKGHFFDNWKMHLHRQRETVGFVERYHGYYFFKNNVKVQKNDDQAGFLVTKTESMQD